MKRIARGVSIVGHPFVMSMVLVVSAALHLSTTREALWTLLMVSGVTLLPVAALMVRQVRKGAWTHADASNPAERPALFAVGIAALILLLGAVFVLQPGSFLVRGAISVLIMLAVCAVATRWIKVSLHMAFAALAAATLLSIGSRVGWIVLAMVPALAWSRLLLGRHTVNEVAIGLLIGIAFGYAMTHI